MKTLKSLGMALVLALSLSIPGYADTDPGDVHTPGLNSPAGTDTDTALPNTCVTGVASEVDTDPSFATIADILWDLVSIY